MYPFRPIRSASRVDVPAFPRLSTIDIYALINARVFRLIVILFDYKQLRITVMCTHIYTRCESHAGFSAQLAYRLLYIMMMSSLSSSSSSSYVYIILLYYVQPATNAYIYLKREEDIVGVTVCIVITWRTVGGGGGRP